MILSDKAIRELVSKKELIIEPFDPSQLEPASMDMRLGTDFKVVEEHDMDIIRMDDDIQYRTIERDYFVIQPHTFVLATTKEYFEFPNNLTAFVEGRSSIGRMGLFIHNAGWIDPGFKGQITLELYNANSVPIKLEAGRRICQFVFAQLDQDAETPYVGKYSGQEGTVGSRISLDREVSSEDESSVKNAGNYNILKD